MKKFRYSLETVLNFKQQVLDRLKEEYALRMQDVQDKRQEIRTLKDQRHLYEREFEGVKRKGAAIEEILIYVRVIERVGERIAEEKKRLAELERLAEEKKQEVIEANVDVNKFEKLKERRLEEYHYQEQKEQENFIEEFVGYVQRA